MIALPRPSTVAPRTENHLARTAGPLTLLLCVPLALITRRAARAASRPKAEYTLAD